MAALISSGCDLCTIVTWTGHWVEIYFTLEGEGVYGECARSYVVVVTVCIGHCLRGKNGGCKHISE